MSEKRLNNTVFLMYLITENYCKQHNISTEDFNEYLCNARDIERERGIEALYGFINEDNS